MSLNTRNFPFLEQDFKSLLFENDFIAIFPELFLVITTIILLVYGVIYTTSKEKKYPLLLLNCSWLGQLSLLYTLLLTLNSPVKNAVLFYNTLTIDSFTFFIKIIIICAALFSTFISLDYIVQESLNAFEYIILILLSTCSMCFLVSSADFISMYLAIECSSLSFYVLAASKRHSDFSTEAGLKYFLLGAFSSGLLLFGCSLVYGFTGVTNFSELGNIFTSGSNFVYHEIMLCQPDWYTQQSMPMHREAMIVSKIPMTTTILSVHGCELGMIFILVGFLFKLTAVPFHMWAPDVYEGAPTSVTAFFAITPKAAILAVFVRIFLESFYDFMNPWQKILIFSSIASMILGSFAAMSQNKIKRLLAFSSIGHVGYLLVGFSCGTIQGLQGMCIYLIIYIVMSISLFTIVLSPVRREGTLSKDFYIHHNPVQRIKYITDLTMLAKTNPILAVTLTITLFSIAGIPPLAGFYSKAFLFFAAMSSTMYLLAVIGVFTSVISCFYYIRLVKIMYFETSGEWCNFSRISKTNSIALGLTFFFILLFIAYPSPLYLYTHIVAISLSV